MTDINADEQIKFMMQREGAESYVLFNAEGVPIKRYEKTISSEMAVHMTAVFQDLWNVSKRVISKELRSNDNLQNDLEIIRLRTKHQFEYIITQSGEYTLIAIQLCGQAIEDKKQRLAQEALEEEQNKENKKK